MRCMNCGAELTESAYCPKCGCDVSVQKQAIVLSGLYYNQGLEKAQIRDLSGSIDMNAGAYGGEMKDVISEITVLDASGNENTLPASELAFGYRTSIVRDRGFLVLSAEISLSAGDAEEIRRKSDDLRMEA